MASEDRQFHATVSAHMLIRVVTALVALWDAVAGAVLLAFHGASTGALGAGVEDEAGQRLLGAHLLLLVPVYLLLAWRPERYQALLWLPFANQGTVVLVIGYNMLKGDTDLSDGILAFAVSSIFVVLFAFLWITEQRGVARMKMEAEESPDAESHGSKGPSGLPGA